MTDVTLETPLAKLLGGRTATAFTKAFGYETVGQLLGHYPRRYATRGELTELTSLPIGENVTIVAEVLQVNQRSMQSRRGNLLEVKITDGRGVLSLTFFNQAWRSRELVHGARGIFAGKVGVFRNTYQLAHPDYELFTNDEAGAGDEAATLKSAADTQRWIEKPIPIYPATASLASWQIQKSIELLLNSISNIEDPVPAEIRAAEGLMNTEEALRLIHLPERAADYERAEDSLRFQEAFVLQIALLERREWLALQPATARAVTTGGLLHRFDEQLAFTLTGDQRAVGEQIAGDLASNRPMNRLVQGEVGSGKTLVALRAMLQVADSGGQAALLAPTEVLASQHLRSIVKTLGPELAAEVHPVLLTGQLPAAERKRAGLAVASGAAKLVVGTHALMSDSVQFEDLGLVVVDEQHRFGVEQREALRQKAQWAPHTVVLTATPIPRTVAMTVFGDLDVSTIRELPAGRAGITSHVVPVADHPSWVNRVWERVSEELAQGRQAFVVCPAIAEAEGNDDVEEGDDFSEALSLEQSEEKTPIKLASVEATLAMLHEHPLFATTRMAALHGKLSSDEKDAIMQAFAAGDIQVLVATTVIEVGVDVPNASTMVVLNSDRFGVSQLHQLRGRVGRGGVPGLCLFVTEAPAGTIARERVDAVAATLDGFELANVDLELRKEGDVLGAAQAGGRSSLRLLRVTRDGDIIERARQIAEGLLADDPGLAAHPHLRGAIDRRLDEATKEYLGRS
ncbi:DEAD/DEAH box helicase [Lysinibacter cavernae]|uniref:Probable DNA 3'-5' helicase RecG n=1 Tax=Lysinibacter cavernae TaxID=1640652 RepID=A0A7X5TRN0_9MICO|nr:ATP-dependent DNA helicase RecG [Lysinibacter cavernae]